MIWLILIVIFVLVVASTWWFGLWSNFITLTNLVLSGLIATSFYHNLVAVLIEPMQTYMVLLEFVSIWAVFVLSFVVLRGATDALSSIRLRFDKLTELIGRSLLSVAIAVVFICFATFTLQLAPLPPDWFSSETSSLSTPGDFADSSPEEIQAKMEEQTKAFKEQMENRKYAEAVGPDKLWLGTVRMLSRNALSAPRTKGPFYGADTRKIKLNDEEYDFQDARVYDPMESFFVEAEFRRRSVSKQEVLRIETGK